MLVYLLAKKVVRDVEISLNQFLKGWEFPTWWIKFRKRWVDLAERDPSDRSYYVTDVSAWSCSCHAFVSSNYLRNFFETDNQPGTDPWNNNLPFAEHGLPEDSANVLPEDRGIGNFNLNEAVEEIIRDENFELEAHAEPNVVAIVRIFAEVNVRGDDDYREEEQLWARDILMRSR
ncbi:hypothetical protein R1sor_008021 [Riccia sorocarpa]|uniref:Transposase n=1 Tax=Riccia sorocarpa TaxID=122646 RepID=A0ABD3HW84_9MARC